MTDRFASGLIMHIRLHQELIPLFAPRAQLVKEWPVGQPLNSSRSKRSNFMRIVHESIGDEKVPDRLLCSVWIGIWKTHCCRLSVEQLLSAAQGRSKPLSSRVISSRPTLFSPRGVWVGPAVVQGSERYLRKPLCQLQVGTRHRHQTLQDYCLKRAGSHWTVCLIDESGSFSRAHERVP
jgi:hypothetical protein